MLVMNKGYQTTYSFQCIELNVNVHADPCNITADSVSDIRGW